MDRDIFSIEPCKHMRVKNTTSVCGSALRDEWKQKWRCQLTGWSAQTEGRTDRGEKRRMNWCGGRSRTLLRSLPTIKPEKELRTNTHANTAQAIIVPCGDFGLPLIVSRCCWPTLTVSSTLSFFFPLWTEERRGGSSHKGRNEGWRRGKGLEEGGVEGCDGGKGEWRGEERMNV